jgi:hypothetical protein
MRLATQGHDISHMKHNKSPEPWFLQGRLTTVFPVMKWRIGPWGARSVLLPRLIVSWFLACPVFTAALAETPRKPLLVLDSHLLAVLGNQIPTGFDVASQKAIDSQRILQQASGGSGLVWIGKVDRLPP